MEVYQSVDVFGLPIVIGPNFFACLMAFARIGGLLHTMPIISARATPVIVRVALACMLTVAILPLVSVDPAAVTWNGPRLALIFASELFLGLTMGMVAAVTLSLLEVCGAFVGMNSGLAMAQAFDANTGSQVLVTTRLLQTTGLLVFLVLDMHHIVFYGLVDSFVVAPPGAGVAHAGAGMGIANFMGQIFLDSMRICMPVAAAVLFVNLVSAMVTRFAQQMNIYFSVGLPANAAVGLFATGLVIPALLSTMVVSMSELRGLLLAVVGGG